MRLEASAVTPGLAKRFQKGTEPSAKSSQSGVLPPKREQFACSCCAGAPFPPASASARTAATRTPNLFTRLTVAARPGDARPRLRTVNGYDLLLVFVERGVHFGDLFRLDVALAGAAAVLDSRRAAEIEPERVQVDAVAAVGVDLLPSSQSTLPSIDASVRTLVVSWKEAAERKDSVASDAFVIPRISGSNVAWSF